MRKYDIRLPRLPLTSRQIILLDNRTQRDKYQSVHKSMPQVQDCCTRLSHYGFQVIDSDTSCPSAVVPYNVSYIPFCFASLPYRTYLTLPTYLSGRLTSTSYLSGRQHRNAIDSIHHPIRNLSASFLVASSVCSRRHGWMSI
jgi:hypothetical protein